MSLVTLQIKTLDGKPSNIGNFAADNQVANEYFILFFWASWCSPCKRQKLIADQMYKDVPVLYLEYLRRETEKITQMPGRNYAVLPPEARSVVAIQGIPTIMLVDPDFNIELSSHNFRDIAEEYRRLVPKNQD